MKSWKIRLVIFVGLLITIFIAGVFIFRPSTESTDLPQFIQADFIDLDKIYSISKFRSGSGHDFSSSGEKCRSMKHYYNTQDTREKMIFYDKNNGIPPKPDGIHDISIYSPVDGEIVGVESEQMPIGKQIYIRPESNSGYTVRLFHVYLDSNFKKGSRVTAGQKIGVISQYQNTDIAIMREGFRRDLISYFDVMPDSIFAKYRERGVSSRDEMIISKEFRDANPFQCNGEMFVREKNNTDPRDFIFLSGYISPDSISYTNNAPAWLKDLIEKEEGGKVANLPASISKCIYGGQTVYYLPPRCCDVPSTVYNDQGNVICSPDGGFTGKGDGKCTDFFDTRKNCAVIWKNSRSK